MEGDKPGDLQYLKTKGTGLKKFASVYVLGINNILILEVMMMIRMYPFYFGCNKFVPK